MNEIPTPTQIEELKPCPFCGSADVVVEQNDRCLQEAGCNGCGAVARAYDFDKDTIKAWNTRQPDAALAQKAGMLDEAVTILGHWFSGLSVPMNTEKFLAKVTALPSTPPAIFDRDEVIEECKNKIKEISNDWQMGGEMQKVYASAYLIENIDALKFSSLHNEVEDSCGCIFKDLDVPCKDKDCKICSPLHKDKA